jgi:uncharacterized tellurite resistance protein B-like protein
MWPARLSGDNAVTLPAGLDTLGRPERLQLLRFVTSFAWADLNVTDAERDFIHRLVTRLHLDTEEARQVEGWIKVPPPPDDIDPTTVPHAHRQIFILTVREMIEADGNVSEEEREALALLEQLTR